MAYFANSGQFGAGMQNPQYQQSPWLVDPTNAIQSGQNDIRRSMNQNMNNVASRLGAQGMIGASPGNSGVYAQQLGNVATDASRQMADVTNKYSYDAANQNANRFLTAQQQQSPAYRTVQHPCSCWPRTPQRMAGRSRTNRAQSCISSAEPLHR